MNHIQFIEALTLFEHGIAMMKKAVGSPATQTEVALNKSQLAEKTGFSRRTIAELMKSGAVPTYEQGRKAKASDIQKAMQDRPAQMTTAGNWRPMRVKSYNWKVFK